tara:strand:+ start:263 stop:370 length:108 start_codon:yes stop_codon:yes gene_type:complete
MGFNPNKEYKANKTDYVNILSALILTIAVVIWALN